MSNVYKLCSTVSWYLMTKWQTNNILLIDVFYLFYFEVFNV